MIKPRFRKPIAFYTGAPGIFDDTIISIYKRGIEFKTVAVKGEPRQLKAVCVKTRYGVRIDLWLIIFYFDFTIKKNLKDKKK